MKCLTVLNPFPVWMFLPANDPRLKRVENRGWSTKYRGLLLIHAGKEPHRSFDPDCEDLAGLLSDLHWGKIVGAVDLLDCVRLVGRMKATFGQVTINGQEHVSSWQRVERVYVPHAAEKRFPWLPTHRHAHGEVCWILDKPRKFPEPVACTGRQGLFTVPDSVKELVEEQLQEAVPV